MMLPHVQHGTVTIRHWSEQQGLSETSQAFETIDDLFAICLQSSEDPNLIDRVIIHGLDAQGSPHTVTLIFQSITVDQTE